MAKVFKKKITEQSVLQEVYNSLCQQIVTICEANDQEAFNSFVFSLTEEQLELLELNEDSFRDNLTDIEKTRLDALSQRARENISQMKQDQTPKQEPKPEPKVQHSHLGSSATPDTSKLGNMYSVDTPRSNYPGDVGRGYSNLTGTQSGEGQGRGGKLSTDKEPSNITKFKHGEYSKETGQAYSKTTTFSEPKSKEAPKSTSSKVEPTVSKETDKTMTTAPKVTKPSVSKSKSSSQKVRFGRTAPANMSPGDLIQAKLSGALEEEIRSNLEEKLLAVYESQNETAFSDFVLQLMK